MVGVTTPLIGVEDVKTPAWAVGYENAAAAGLRTVARTTLRTSGLLIGWAWRASPRLTLLTGVVQLVAGAVTAFGLLATANVFTSLLEQGPTPERLLGALPGLALVVAAYALRGLLDAAVATVQAALVPLVERRAQDDLHAAVLGLDLVAFDDADFTELVDRVAEQSITRIRMGTNVTGDLLASLVSMLAAVVTAGLLHPLLPLAVLAAAAPQGWATLTSARAGYRSFVRTLSRVRRMGVTGHLITHRDNAAELRAFTAEPVLLAQHRRISGELATEAVRLGHRRTRIQLAGRTLSGLGTAAGYALLGALVYVSAVPLALAGAAALAMRIAGQAVSSTVYESNQLVDAGYYIELYRTCLAGAAGRRRPPPTAVLHGDPEVVTLTDVAFRYPGAEELAVDGVSVTMRRGEVIALVGENGSGKSTLAKLMVGLYVAERGCVDWDGVDLAHADPADVLSRVAVVLQEPVHWPTSAENNVRIGRLDRADDGDAARDSAARDSGADAVVAELPDGWPTVLSREFQAGRDLSGGQWQRMSVARGLYRDAPFVVADEPTAALDARAEHAVFATLHGRTGAGADRITVLVTHRLANVRYADRILVLDRGRLIESGRHDELIALGGVYQELFALQASAYTVDA
ncbi:ABC transporter ATP-binding protein [Pseudonocardia sp. KRD-184]|uniref:ABC transporter ATP-binding protein n=1 Tax=Pseudonocardia oceani TaxID=2792013 RepID=A0ABS6U4Y9_9PSEU|nr:ABC transporter ATP-binding protein [Pseudonocardia oceani]MBW0091295.1 ABC transporter ATP-binding protein [Pseudonocardia oceani]MBW0097363.1 ABC transporter ATP-binding protein [Pseudonocardia oceani]MBW0110484.1 ABC transporter ATP-binding protein [Pseudonocardia oceani]MBW0124575.1 ABC transporter ATP-binding protein [Pseudonocardia oceani]MBW0127295.1 ABC transporter ATP-binding protein [Pseudonocardia oceani]